MSDEEIHRVAREIVRAMGSATVEDPRFEILSPAYELPPADEDRVIRAIEAMLLE